MLTVFGHTYRNELTDTSNFTDTATWQVVLALIVALVTAYTTYLFTDYIKRRADLRRLKSKFSKYSYLLGQTWSNRLQSDIHFIYYKARMENANNRDAKSLFIEMVKEEHKNQPKLALGVSDVYSRLVECITEIESLVSKGDVDKIKKKSDIVLKHKTYSFNDPGGLVDEEAANKYLAEAKLEQKNRIESEIKKPLKALEDIIQKTKAPFFKF